MGQVLGLELMSPVIYKGIYTHLTLVLLLDDFPRVPLAEGENGVFNQSADSPRVLVAEVENVVFNYLDEFPRVLVLESESKDIPLNSTHKNR